MFPPHFRHVFLEAGKPRFLFLSDDPKLTPRGTNTEKGRRIGRTWRLKVSVVLIKPVIVVIGPTVEADQNLRGAFSVLSVECLVLFVL